MLYLLALVKFTYLISCAISIRIDAMHESGKYNIIVHQKEYSIAIWKQICAKLSLR